MDSTGWHAQRRADKDQESYLYLHRTDSGQYYPVQHATPLPESSIGGTYSHYPAPPLHPGVRHHATSGELAHLSAAERSRRLWVARMDPPLQFMCGPLLKYDTVVDGIWYGAALIITADSGSTYHPAPFLTYEWDSDKSTVNYIERTVSGSSFKLGPHPCDPGTLINGNELPSKQSSCRKQVEGQEIHVYAEPDGSGTYTFWRFFLEIPMGENEAEITYHINRGQRMHFYIPGRNQNMRWAAHSCNGFSAGVNPDDFRGPGYQSGYDPLWIDLLTKHSEKPFHAMVGGGDQLYCDSLMREPEMQDWIRLKPDEKKQFQLTEKISQAIDRFFFHHYCENFRRGAFARANSSIPMLNMCDDHDLIDGFGSYPDDLQRAPVFQQIGARGFFFYLLFQCFINVDIDGVDDRPGQHIYKSLIIGDWGPYVRLPSHSFLSYLGPQCSILLLDCRAERTLERVCSAAEYRNVFRSLQQLPPQVEHLVVQLGRWKFGYLGETFHRYEGIPIAYPRMVFLETALGSKLNPLVALGRAGQLGSIGLSGFVNKFNADAELLDDLNDHWTARYHKQERNWLVEQFQGIARAQGIRISFLSGDVHCAAVGIFKTLRQKDGGEIALADDYRYMVNIVTSAIVNTPPPAAVLAMVSSLATKTHKALHRIDTDETMAPLFSDDTDGSQRKQKHIMGRRNWCQITWESSTGELIFDLRVEKEKGIGTTVGYVTRVPAPKWSRG
ncbi:hypothetical protein AX15_004912 [Amanita polypyramis BW_CC]|nr:hypothetical protein AX15_004912 [Amanita polypyramis BW_CC]